MIGSDNLTRGEIREGHLDSDGNRGLRLGSQCSRISAMGNLQPISVEKIRYLTKNKQKKCPLFVGQENDPYHFLSCYFHVFH